jgi:hypothetical protein
MTESMAMAMAEFRSSSMNNKFLFQAHTAVQRLFYSIPIQKYSNLELTQKSLIFTRGEQVRQFRGSRSFFVFFPKRASSASFHHCMQSNQSEYQTQQNFHRLSSNRSVIISALTAGLSLATRLVQIALFVFVVSSIDGD